MNCATDKELSVFDKLASYLDASASDYDAACTRLMAVRKKLNTDNQAIANEINECLALLHSSAMPFDQAKSLIEKNR